MKWLALLLVFAAASLNAFAQGNPSPRTPQFPLKTERMLFSDEEIALARKNIAEYPKAKAIADGIVKTAESWVNRSYDDLLMLMPPARVPRAFNVGTEGCPKCGKAIYEQRGTYPWLIDLDKPFKVTCPICKGVFPDNDFGAYYRSGFKDKQFLEGEYADDGWGWVGPPGDHRYWFVAYATHWIWHSHVIRGIHALGRAYVLTGDKRYAHQAALMLHRVAEVYPATDYHNQSRYGQLEGARGGHYGGKLTNLIWACGNLTAMAEAYDAVWETIDGDTALRQTVGKTGAQIRAHIEANLLEEGMDAIFANEVRGNFGMQQRALVYTALARQHGDTRAWIDRIFSPPGSGLQQPGLNYALYNMVYRDGVPYETAPGYNSIWFRAITTIAEALKGTEWDVYALPKTKRLYDGVLDIVNCGQFTPALADSGSINGGKVTDSATFQAAYRAYGDPRYLNEVASLSATGENTFQSFESLLCPAIEASAPEVSPAKPRLLDGYGMAILNNPADTISTSLYYGFKGGHGHFDRLHFSVFAYGHPMLPDLGYPDFMNGYVSGIYSWSKATVAHNTVTVDAQRQGGNQAGTVQSFVDGGFARVVDINAPETYPQCSTYRRHLVMVDVDAERSYFVDFFTVAGGNQHDYSLHGCPGPCEIIGGDWETQEKGTLAGQDVPVGALYDDPERSVEGYKGTFYGYRGSGFQHMVNVRRHTGGAWLAHFSHRSDPAAHVRIHPLNPPDTQAILTNAQVSPVKHKELLTYLIARRTGTDLTSRFAAVLEPFMGQPFVRSTRRVDVGDACAIIVELTTGRSDVILFNPNRETIELAEFSLKTDAQSAAVRVRANSPTQVSFFGGDALAVGGKTFEAKALRGEVVSVHPQSCLIDVRIAADDLKVNPKDLVGRIVHFENGIRRTAHPVADATLKGDILTITTRDDLLVGRAPVKKVEQDALTTEGSFEFAPVYRGTYVTDEAFGALYPLTGLKAHKVNLRDPLPAEHAFKAGQDAWIVNVGPGDRLEIPAILTWKADEE